jgi:hypothetical protein
MTLPEMKSGLLMSGVPGLLVDGTLREDEFDEPAELPRCAVAAGASKAITSAAQVLNRKELCCMAASMKACRTFK